MDLTKYDLVLFKNSIIALNVSLDDSQIAQFMEYYELLVEWNQFMNLTAIIQKFYPLTQGIQQRDPQLGESDL